jgi:histidine triad (HIT) family protein
VNHFLKLPLNQNLNPDAGCAAKKVTDQSTVDAGLRDDSRGASMPIDTSLAYDDQNVFAKILRGELPAQKIYEDDKTLALMDIMPRGDGHCLVIPKAPSRNVLDIAEADLFAVMSSVQKLARAVVKAFDADGATIQQFSESAGGQVVFHTHVHVIPRFEGVALKPHTGTMAEQSVLADHAERIRAALAD